MSVLKLVSNLHTIKNSANALETKHMKKESLVVMRMTILALGFLVVVPVVSAAESKEANVNNSVIDQSFASDMDLSVRSPFQSSRNFSLAAVTESSAGEPDASELNADGHENRDQRCPHA